MVFHAFGNGKPFKIFLIDRCQPLAPFDDFSFLNRLPLVLPLTSQKTNMAEYMESNVTLISNLVKDNKTYKQVSEILRQNFPEVTRGCSERNVRLFCAKYGIRRMNEYEVDSIVQDCVNEVSLFSLYFLFVCFNTVSFTKVCLTT